MNARTDLFKPEALDSAGRRRFLQQFSAAGGLVLVSGHLGAQEPKKYGADGMPHGWVDDALAFVSLAPDGPVSIVCPRSEMGPGVRTSMLYFGWCNTTGVRSSRRIATAARVRSPS